MKTRHLLSGSPLLCLLGIAILTLPAAAQTTAPNEWTWVGGSSTYNQSGAYGTLETPAAGNIPGARSDVASWTDSSGHLWLFGGYGYDTNGNVGYLNDLWEYNPATNEWTWEGGSNTVPSTETYIGGPSGVYGAMGTPGAGNIPGGRSGASSWTDGSGNLWLFGGEGFDSVGNSGLLNDLWEFNPATKEWTWMEGSETAGSGCNATEGLGCGQPGVYGTLKSPAIGNTPGGRRDATSWTDNGGNLWLFGGAFTPAIGMGDSGIFNDLWEFSPSSKEWTWMGGSDSINCVNGLCSVVGVYGTLGSPATGNIPGSRLGSSSWKDSSGNLWLFGGISAVTPFNDLWEFNPSTDEWAWISGSNTNTYMPQSGTYGTLGAPAAGNVPGGRKFASSWIDSRSNLWLYGGDGDDANGTEGILDDLWEFDISTNDWTWMGGSSTVDNRGYYGNQGVYGNLGTPNAGNIPGQRGFAVSWTDSSRNLWLFGGASGSSLTLNDLWVYQPSTGPLPTTATPIFSVTTGSYTTWQTVTITDATNGASIYYTTDGSTPTTSSNVYNYPPSAGNPITISSTETLKAIAIANNSFNSAVASATYTLNLPTAATPVITPAAGTYSSAQTITITDATAGAAIYYTTNGSAPTTGSTLYAGPFPLSGIANVQAIAVATNYNNSAVAATSYSIDVDFSVPTTLPSLTIETGNNAFDTITVTPINGFNSAVLFTCSGLPTEATCSFNPPTVTGGGSTTITVNATAPYTAALLRPSNPLFPASALAVLFCCFGLRKRRRLQMLLLIVMGMAGLSFIASCGGGGGGGTTITPPYFTPLPNTETVTVTATSGSLSHTTTFTLTVN